MAHKVPEPADDYADRPHRLYPLYCGGRSNGPHFHLSGRYVACLAVDQDGDCWPVIFDEADPTGRVLSRGGLDQAAPHERPGRLPDRYRAALGLPTAPQRPWLELVLARQVHGTAFAVAAVLHTHQGDDGACRLSLADLGRKAGVGTHKARHAVRLLAELGLLDVERRPGRANAYRPGYQEGGR